MASGDEESIHASIEERHGIDTRNIEFRTVSDQREALATDVAGIRAYAMLPKTLQVAGAIYNVHTGELEPIDC
jgi:carbonic anhydrase